jgi:hypothetical protein
VTEAPEETTSEAAAPENVAPATNEAAPPKRVRRLWLIVPWTLFALLVIGWVYYWNAVASEARGRVEAWFAAEREAGADAAFTGIRMHGFPVLMRLEIQGVRYAPSRGQWRLESDRVDLNLNLVDLEHLILESKAPITITPASGARQIIDADALLFSVRMKDGAFVEAGLEADALSIDNPDAEGVMRVRKTMLGLRPDPRRAGDYQLSVDVTALELARPVRSFENFTQTIAQWRSAIVIEHGADVLTMPKDDPLGPWREAGGQARIEALGLHWGPLEATGQGNVHLDEQRRLVGRLDLDIPRPAPALQALADSENLSRNTARALGVIALGYVVTGGAVSFDLEARDGLLYFESVPVRALDPIY